MVEINVNLTALQLEELIQNVIITEYVEYLHMPDWNDSMTGESALEIIDSIDADQFDTSDRYAVVDGRGLWVSSDSLEEILEPYLDEMLQEYIDNNL